MKNFIFYCLLLTGTLSFAQIVEIPDTNFKDALINTASVDTDADGVPDADADLNDDGEIQESEAAAVIGLYVSELEIGSLAGIEYFTNLEVLHCWQNNIATIDVTQNQALTSLICFANIINEIDLSQNIQLQELNIVVNSLVDIDVSSNINLEILHVGSNYLTDLNTSQNVNLINLSAGANSLISLDVSQNINLETLGLLHNHLPSIDVSQNPNLRFLDVGNNFLQELDVTQNTLLETLGVSSLDLQTIDLSQNTELRTFGSGQTHFKELDFSNNPNLGSVNVWGNNAIAELDFSQNPQLYEMHSYFMPKLIRLNLRNGNNANLGTVSAFQNPDLFCIEVDNPDYSNNHPNWGKDDWATYSENCALGVNDLEAISLSLYPNPAQDVLHINSLEPLERVRIYAVNGSLVQESSASRIDVSALPAGMYLVFISTDDKNLVKRFVKS